MKERWREKERRAGTWGDEYVIEGDTICRRNRKMQKYRACKYMVDRDREKKGL